MDSVMKRMANNPTGIYHFPNNPMLAYGIREILIESNIPREFQVDTNNVSYESWKQKPFFYVRYFSTVDVNALDEWERRLDPPVRVNRKGVNVQPLDVFTFFGTFDRWMEFYSLQLNGGTVFVYGIVVIYDRALPSFQFDGIYKTGVVRNIILPLEYLHLYPKVFTETEHERRVPTHKFELLKENCTYYAMIHKMKLNNNLTKFSSNVWSLRCNNANLCLAEAPNFICNNKKLRKNGNYLMHHNVVHCKNPEICCVVGCTTKFDCIKQRRNHFHTVHKNFQLEHGYDLILEAYRGRAHLKLISANPIYGMNVEELTREYIYKSILSNITNDFYFKIALSISTHNRLRFKELKQLIHEIRPTTTDRLNDILIYLKKIGVINITFTDYPVKMSINEAKVEFSRDLLQMVKKYTNCYRARALAPELLLYPYWEYMKLSERDEKFLLRESMRKREPIDRAYMNKLMSVVIKNFKKCWYPLGDKLKNVITNDEMFGMFNGELAVNLHNLLQNSTNWILIDMILKALKDVYGKCLDESIENAYEIRNAFFDNYEIPQVIVDDYEKVYTLYQLVTHVNVMKFNNILIACNEMISESIDDNFEETDLYYCVDGGKLKNLKDEYKQKYVIITTIHTYLKYNEMFKCVTNDSRSMAMAYDSIGIEYFDENKSLSKRWKNEYLKLSDGRCMKLAAVAVDVKMKYPDEYSIGRELGYCIEKRYDADECAILLKVLTNSSIMYDGNVLNMRKLRERLEYESNWMVYSVLQKLRIDAECIIAMMHPFRRNEMNTTRLMVVHDEMELKGIKMILYSSKEFTCDDKLDMDLGLKNTTNNKCQDTTIIKSNLNYHEIMKYYTANAVTANAVTAIATANAVTAIAVINNGYKTMNVVENDFYYTMYPNWIFDFDKIIKILTPKEIDYLRIIYLTQEADCLTYEENRAKITDIPQNIKLKFVYLNLCLNEKYHLIPKVASSLIARERIKKLNGYNNNILFINKLKTKQCYISLEEAIKQMQQIKDISVWNNEDFIKYFDQYCGKYLEDIPLQKVHEYHLKRVTNFNDLYDLHKKQYNVSSYGKYFNFMWCRNNVYLKKKF